MPNLIDADQLKVFFIDHILEKEKRANLLIGSEIMYGMEKRLVDILLLYPRRTIAIEIKSDNDNLYRLKSQLQQYRNVFDFTYILTTSKHYSEISNMVRTQSNVGIILYKEKKFIVVRKAKKNLRISKVAILSSMNLLFQKSIFSIPAKIKTGKDVRNYVGANFKIAQIQSAYRKYLREKLLDNFHLFLKERGDLTVVDDLPILSYYKNSVLRYSQSSCLLCDMNIHSNGNPE